MHLGEELHKINGQLMMVKFILPGRESGMFF